MAILPGLLSYIVPITVWEGQGRYGPLKLVYESGHMVVNSDHANQSWGALHEVWQQCFMDRGLERTRPGRVLILGFGAGSVASILRKELRIQAPIVGVDGDPGMLDLARTRFKVDRLGGIHLVEMDAFQYLTTATGRFDLVVVDLFHELDMAPGLEDPETVRQLGTTLTENGSVCINTVVHDRVSDERSQRLGLHLRHCFRRVGTRTYNGINRVFTASSVRSVHSA